MKKEQKSLLKRLNEIDNDLDVIVSSFGSHGYLIIIPETKQYKEQSFSVVLEENTVENFVSELKEEIRDSDDVAIFMYKYLRKSPIALRDVITEAEQRLQKMASFVSTLEDL